MIDLEDNIQIVASGEKWVGYGTRSFSSVVEEAVSQTRNSLVMTIYVITDMNIVRSIESALEKGVSVEIYMYSHSSFQSSRAVNRINNLEKEFSYMKVHRFENEVLHAKVLVSDRKRVITGSANPTFGGMVKNYEIGFLIEDESIAHETLKLLRRLLHG